MVQTGQSTARTPRPLGALLRDQVRAHGHRPLLTYYGLVTGERTELSFATFDNWASKAANLFAEELQLERGGRIVLTLTDHWCGAVILAAAWKIGAAVVLGGGEASAAADVVVASEAAIGAGAEQHPGLVVVGAGIGGRVTGDPPGLHFGDEVLAFADDYDDPAVDAGDVAVELGGTVLTHAALGEDQGLDAEDRVLVTATLDTTLAIVTAPVAAGASVVWCPTDRIDVAGSHADDERCTHVLDGGSIRPL